MRPMANQIRWYKRDPNAALEGMAVLTLEERGAYNTILDLIYSHDGKVDDDDRFIAGWLRVDVRVWRRIRGRLLDLGKLYLHAGSMRNERADREVLTALHRVASAAQAGLASAAKQDGDRRIINGLASTAVERTSQLPTPTPTPTKKAFFASSASILSRAREVQEAPGAGHQKRPSELSRTELDQAIRRRHDQGESAHSSPSGNKPVQGSGVASDWRQSRDSFRAARSALKASLDDSPAETGGGGSAKRTQRSTA